MLCCSNTVRGVPGLFNTMNCKYQRPMLSGNEFQSFPERGAGGGARFLQCTLLHGSEGVSFFILNQNKLFNKTSLSGVISGASRCWARLCRSSGAEGGLPGLLSAPGLCSSAGRCRRTRLALRPPRLRTCRGARRPPAAA